MNSKWLKGILVCLITIFVTSCSSQEMKTVSDEELQDTTLKQESLRYQAFDEKNLFTSYEGEKQLTRSTLSWDEKETYLCDYETLITYVKENHNIKLESDIVSDEELEEILSKDEDGYQYEDFFRKMYLTFISGDVLGVQQGLYLDEDIAIIPINPDSSKLVSGMITFVDFDGFLEVAKKYLEKNDQGMTGPENKDMKSEVREFDEAYFFVEDKHTGKKFVVEAKVEFLSSDFHDEIAKNHSRIFAELPTWADEQPYVYILLNPSQNR